VSAADDRTIVRTLAESLTALPYQTWNFGDSVAFEALLEASDLLGDDRWAAFAQGWARAWASRATPYRELDCTAPGWAIVRLAERGQDPYLLEAAARLAEHLVARPTIRGLYRTWQHSPLMHPYGPARLAGREAAWVADPPPGSFLDCLHFDPPFLTALGRAVQSAPLLEAGVAQALTYVDVLQQADGLFDHFVLDGVPGTFGPGWGRGQGWAILGLLDVLDELDALDDPEPHAAARKALRGAVERLVDRLVALQRPDGHWYAVVDDPASGDEFSTAAFMAAGFYRGLRTGVLAGREIEDAARLATAAVRAGIGPDGTLAEVSAAVMACTEPSHYAHVPRGFRVPWGQGPALLALAEGLRWEGR
jgi:unsaturated rhamnogalacturonyl hydrolase